MKEISNENLKNVERKWSDEESKIFYENLLQKALRQIPPSGQAMVLGPMFILGEPEKNFLRFEKAQSDLQSKNIDTFNQVPFVDYNLKEAPFNYKLKFEIFYKGLMNSGKILICYLLPGWEQSEGTKTEIEYCKESGIPIVEI